jgi:hypothetical protein
MYLIPIHPVIYDNDLTDAIFDFLEDFLRRQSARIAIFSLERRVIFTTDGFRVAAPAYEYFRSKFDSIETPKEEISASSSRRLSGTRLPLPQQYFVDYERTNELELWQIHA